MAAVRESAEVGINQIALDGNVWHREVGQTDAG